MADIFISYKKEDRKYAKRIAEVLAQRGHDVWWDIELLAGDKFADVINGILSKVKATVVLWTPESTNSPWVKSEALVAFHNDSIIPVIMRDTEIPVPFNTLHTLDLSAWVKEGDDRPLGVLVKSIEQKLDTQFDEMLQRSDKDVDEALQKPKHEIEYWESISNARIQSIPEYQLYIDKYGKNSAFYELALQRMEALTFVPKRRRYRVIVILMSIIGGILVGGLAVAIKLGVFARGEPLTETAKKPGPTTKTESLSGREAVFKKLPEPISESAPRPISGRAAEKNSHAPKSDVSKIDPAKNNEFQFDKYVGKWRGLVYQRNSATLNNYTTILEIKIVDGALQVTSNYPELNCGGVSTLIKINKQTNLLQFNEVITYGRNACINGTFTLTLTDANTMQWNWQNMANGVLKKQE